MGQRQVDDRLLREWSLPQPDGDSDKAQRGDALIVGGSRETPGAVLLAAVAAFRVGAGRVCIGTAASAASGLAVALPEARVIGLPESEQGALLTAGVDQLIDVGRRCGAVLIGPGCMDETCASDFARSFLGRAGSDTRLVVDAGAMDAVPGRPSELTQVIVTPHAGEMAHLLGISKSEVLGAAAEHAIRSARDWNCVVVLKGATTFVASAQGQLWRHDGGSVGLATAGSGDVLAGLITGLLARGAELEQAAVWGVSLHALAGKAVTQRLGKLGLMASELSGEIPRLLRDLCE